MGALFDKLLALLIPTLILLHLLCSPYTKVEESFTLQATHDILTYGIPTRNISETLHAQYDHFTFPGAVPRTFTGALVLAALSKFGIEGKTRQIVVRGVLGLLNSAALLVFRRSVSAAFGSSAANWFVLFQACQFHVLYYASRTLPNMFAFALSTLALERLLPIPFRVIDRRNQRKNAKLAIYLLTFTGIVFRSEIAILLATHTAYLWARGRVSLRGEIIPAGLVGALLGLLVTVSVDSFFWQKLIWPEVAGFYFNAIQGNAIAWGTSPWHFYFTNALPRLLLNPLSWQLCIPLALGLRATRGRSLDILVPLLAFVAIYSLQPHKEWRFILYTIPGLTAVSAVGADWIWTRRAKSLIYRFLSMCLIGSVLASFVASLGFLAISQLNYPGAAALTRLHEIAYGSQNLITVHMDTLSCTSGITRFLEMPALTLPGSTSWQYDKTEDPDVLLTPEFWEKFDYALAEEPERVIGKWEIIEEIEGYAGIGIARTEKRTGEKAHDESRLWLERLLEQLYSVIPHSIRQKVLGDRWVRIRMEPVLRIMKRLPPSPPTAQP